MSQCTPFYILFFGFMLMLQQLSFGQIPIQIKKEFNGHLKFISKLPKQLKEASGLIQTKDNLLWSHNDDGLPVLYGFDTTGVLQKTIYLNHQNKGWEDLAINGNGDIFIGAFGNNKNDNKALKVYKVKNPETIDAIYSAETIQYRYKDQTEFPPSPPLQNFDMDAFVWFDLSLYLFSKNRTIPNNGICSVYKLADSIGGFEAKKIDQLTLDKSNPMINNWVTAADYNEKNKLLVLLFHNRVMVITNPVFGKLSQNEKYVINLGHYSHKAGICFNNKGNKLYIVDEIEFGIGGNLYEVDLMKFFPT